MVDNIIDAENVSIAYKLYDNPKDRLKEALSPSRRKYHKEFFALKNINFKVSKGQVVGIVGRNGAGKSTLLKILAGILQPSSGKVHVKGKVFALLELGAGFNPEFTGLENIYFYGMIHDIDRGMMDGLVEDIIEFTNIGDFIHQPLKTYSTGMRARLAFAAATAVKPDVLIVDEVLSVGDVQFQRKSYARMEKLIEGGTTVLYVSHSHGSIVEICSRVMMMSNGELILDGTSRNVVKLYLKSLDSSTEIPKEILREELSKLENKQDVNSGKKTAQLQGSIEKNSGELLQKTVNDKSSQLMSSSMVELHNAAVTLKDITIEDESGLASTLTHGRSYILTATFTFEEVVENVVFPFWIATKQGFCVAGIRHPDDNTVISMIGEGSSVTVKWDFCANMLPGDYFVTVGVTTIKDGQKHGVYRANDAAVFKVVNYNARVEWGLVSLQQQLLDFKVEKINIDI